jgi:hypothetical protein
MRAENRELHDRALNACWHLVTPREHKEHLGYIASMCAADEKITQAERAEAWDYILRAEKGGSK